jgi:N6-L-threonylcarbamoyladenine synthase
VTVRVLGIESSCDETAAAVVQADGLVLSDVVSSQVAVHAPYGGIVPELASRAHLTNVVPVIERALEGIGWGGIDAISVTRGPGLIGALLIGLQTAKAIAFARDLPITFVDHLVGHLFAVYLWRDEAARLAPELPYVALLVSGGHTAIYEVSAHDRVRVIGQTRDDAAGEAFDKVAKLLGLGYPGGPIVDRLAQLGNPRAVELPIPMSSKRTLDFSFSGLKTAVARLVREKGVPKDEQALADLCASFQRSVARVLAQKSVAACAQLEIPRLVLAGGVAANRGLRESAHRECAKAGIALFVPPPSACTDNAAMIAYVGAQKSIAGVREDLDLPAYSRSPDVRRGKVVPSRP